MKWFQSAVGVLLIAGGLAGWFLLPHRGEVVVLALVGLGGFLVDAGHARAFAAVVVDYLRGRTG